MSESSEGSSSEVNLPVSSMEIEAKKENSQKAMKLWETST
jgi:hypothetical protein